VIEYCQRNHLHLVRARAVLVALVSRAWASQP
jgi:hypothetical protein